MAFAVRPGPDLGLVRADPGQVEQVLLNLVVNARDAMPRGGRLTLGTANVDLGAAHARPGPHVVLSVADTGTGMADEVRGRIFEPFFTTKEAGKGTGLGLATVLAVAKQSGGHVEVDSEVGAGSTFRVYFPRVGPAPRPEREPAPAAPAPRGVETVLVAEDEPAVRDFIARVLRDQGYEVLTAGDGADALRRADRHGRRIDLLVADVVMPALGGPELARRLAAAHPAMKVLFLSGYAEDAAARTGVPAEFLTKPFARWRWRGRCGRCWTVKRKTPPPRPPPRGGEGEEEQNQTRSADRPPSPPRGGARGGVGLARTPPPGPLPETERGSQRDARSALQFDPPPGEGPGVGFFA